MVLMTMIARVADGLPLAASMQEEDSTADKIDFTAYQSQAKQLFKGLSASSKPRLSIEMPHCTFHYSISQGVCFLALCAKNFPSRTAFAYLDEISGEFMSSYMHKVNSVTRPYHFIEFDRYMNKARKQILQTSSSSRANRPTANPGLDPIQKDLQNIQKIMVDNINDIMDRGKMLEDLSDKAAQLSVAGKMYSSDASKLNNRSFVMKCGIAAAVLLLPTFYIYLFLL